MYLVDSFLYILRYLHSSYHLVVKQMLYKMNDVVRVVIELEDNILILFVNIQTCYVTRVRILDIMLGIHSGFYPWGSVGIVKCSAQCVRNTRN
jgi:hypothetical protein